MSGYDEIPPDRKKEIMEKPQATEKEKCEDEKDYSHNFGPEINLGHIIDEQKRQIKCLETNLAEKEKEIAELEKEKMEIIQQLETVLEMEIYTNHNIESAIRQGTTLYYTTRNKLEIWRNKFKK